MNELCTDYKQINRSAWNALTLSHVKSEFYNVESFMRGESTLKPLDLELLGEVSGKSFLHLQCHFGLDTLSSAKKGAVVTGVDLSPEAIDTATTIAEECEIPATFICSDLYDFGETNRDQFDIVYTSYGVLTWLPDLTKWARVVASALKPGGTFHLIEFHPQMWLIQGEQYFPEKPEDLYNELESYLFEMESYTDAKTETPVPAINWPHSLAEVITSLIEAGLQIESFCEYPSIPYGIIEGAEEREPGEFFYQHEGVDVPLLYSIKAKKNA